jgi:hypothetical protein
MPHQQPATISPFAALLMLESELPPYPINSRHVCDELGEAAAMGASITHCPSTNLQATFVASCVMGGWTSGWSVLSDVLIDNRCLKIPGEHE